MAETMNSIVADGELPVAATEKAVRQVSTAVTTRQGEEPVGLSRRAIGVGLVLVAFVAAVTPYNDYILHNSPFIGNHFPIGIVTLMAVLILVVNPALAWMGKRAFASGELIVIMTMMLVAPFHHIQQFPWLKSVTDLLPSWLFPTTDANSPIVSNYWLGVDPVQGGRVPVVAFLLPQLIWGVLVAAIMGASLFLAAIFQRQWVHHERLPYPLATIPLELMAAPEPGRLYNSRWRNPVLWTGAAIPILVYLLAGLHSHWAAVPQVDLHFSLREAFRDRPWDALPNFIVDARLYFAAVGICFFIPSEVAFSLWLFVILNGLSHVFFARTSFDPGRQQGARDMGAYVAYFAGLLWLARGHLKYVLMSAWRRAPRGEDEPVTYRTMVVGWLVCMAVAWVWLMVVGMNPLMALLLLGVGTMLVTLMARIVAETGLFYVNVGFWPRDLFGALLGRGVLNAKNYLWTEYLSGIFYADFRENLMPFATNSLRMGQEIPAASEKKRDQRGGWFRWLGVALVVSTLISGSMNHYLSYTYGRNAIEDVHASDTLPGGALKNTFGREHSPPETTLGSSWRHFSVGSAMAVGLMVGRVMWAAWPFHPIGLVLMNSSSMQVLWFSIFIGWGAKRLLLRYGGAGAFKRARPFFIGLIMGEVLAAGVWMFIGLSTNGAVHYSLLPG